MATLRIKLEARYWYPSSQEWTSWDYYEAHHDTDRIAGLMYHGRWDTLKLKDKKGNKTQVRRIKE